jgi:hypothetical protein
MHLPNWDPSTFRQASDVPTSRRLASVHSLNTLKWKKRALLGGAIKTAFAAAWKKVPIRSKSCNHYCGSSSAMSPHRVPVLPSLAALSQYGISKNGFLPEEAPLNCLPHDYYQPWERMVKKLPSLIDTQEIRQCVDELPVLETKLLASESEWQRAHSMLAVMAQGYIWTGPEPSEVGEHMPGVL